jgi:enoyl-[acyl-carrier protein] reductase II
MVLPWQQFCDRVGVRYPIMQDGMGPSPTTELAIAVASAGGLGSLSVPGLLTPEPELRRRVRDRMHRVATETTGHFAMNIPVGTLETGDLLPATEICIDEAIRCKLADGPVAERFVAITTSAGFGGGFTKWIQDAGLLHIHKVGSVHHAKKAADAGADIIIASGYEMGGHTHLHPVHTMVLAPQVIEAVDCPVVVSGGIYDGHGMAAMLAMGAAGIAMGTRFIVTREHEWHENYKQAIVDAREWSDTIYQGYYAPCRAIKTKGLVEDLPAAKARMSVMELNQWKEDRGYAAQLEGDVVNGFVIAGQCAAAINDIVPAQELIERIVTQATALLRSAGNSAEALAKLSAK